MQECGFEEIRIWLFGKGLLMGDERSYGLTVSLDEIEKQIKVQTYPRPNIEAT